MALWLVSSRWHVLYDVHVSPRFFKAVSLMFSVVRSAYIARAYRHDSNPPSPFDFGASFMFREDCWLRVRVADSTSISPGYLTFCLFNPLEADACSLVNPYARSMQNIKHTRTGTHTRARAQLQKTPRECRGKEATLSNRILHPLSSVNAVSTPNQCIQTMSQFETIQAWACPVLHRRPPLHHAQASTVVLTV